MTCFLIKGLQVRQSMTCYSQKALASSLGEWGSAGMGNRDQKRGEWGSAGMGNRDQKRGEWGSAGMGNRDQKRGEWGSVSNQKCLQKQGFSYAWSPLLLFNSLVV